MEVRSKRCVWPFTVFLQKLPPTRGSISKNIQVLVVWRVHSFSLSVSAVINFVLIIRAGTYNSAIQGKEVKSRKNSKMKNASWKIAIVFSVCALPLATTKGELTTKDYWTVQAPPRRQEGLHYRYKKLREECLESDSPRGTCLALFQTCDLAPHHHHLAE